MLLPHLILAVITGLLCAAIAFAGGWSFLWAFLAYSVGGSLGLVLSVSAVLLRDFYRSKS